MSLAVSLPSGAPFEVLTADEGAFLKERSDKYQDQIAFTQITDLASLDTVLQLELTSHRWNQWIALGEDYDGTTVDVIALNKEVKSLSQEIRQVKKLLGIDKVTRDRARGEGSLPHYIAGLLRAAGEFGIHRAEQADRAFELMNEAVGLAQAWKNSTPAERRDLHITADDICEWLLETAGREMADLDAWFRENHQRYWIADL